jgi:hypothetical protein
VFFRAQSTAAAWNLWLSLIGVNGFTMTRDVTNPLRMPGTLWSKLGFHFVQPVFKVQSYDDLIKTVLLLLALVLLLRNSQQWVAEYRPVLEPVQTPKWWRARLGWASGLCLGCGFYLVIRSFFVATPSPFVYFNF